MKFYPHPTTVLSLVLASGNFGILCAQAMPPTPLWNGAQAQFMNLANPDTTAEKLAIYAKYYDLVTPSPRDPAHPVQG
jgi:hypothetical protein